jgi:hypothetical protein
VKLAKFGAKANQELPMVCDNCPRNMQFQNPPVPRVHEVLAPRASNRKPEFTVGQAVPDDRQNHFRHNLTYIGNRNVWARYR